jgi:isopentenyl-diphosphate Delta-isomerase
VHRAGLLHRAFSTFIVDDQGRILLQRRSREKYHSGGLLANSCCGHPRPGETTQAAARRRLTEELGIEAPLKFGFFSRYRAKLNGGMQENEYVYVYFGPLTAQPNPDSAEVSEVEFASADEIARRIARDPDEYVYWLRHYFENHGREIARLAKRTARLAAPIAAGRSRKREALPARR